MLLKLPQDLSRWVNFVFFKKHYIFLEIYMLLVDIERGSRDTGSIVTHSLFETTSGTEAGNFTTGW